MKLLNVNNEFGKLKKVVLGIANSNGGTPKIEDCYDPKSRGMLSTEHFHSKKI